MKGFKAVAVLFVSAILILLLVGIYKVPGYSFDESKVPGNFQEYFSARLKQSEELNVRPGNEERLVRYSPNQSEYAILFIHGFTATRAGGEYYVEQLAARYQANTYYMRLPGHGTSPDDHANTSFRDYLDEVEIAIRLMPELGEKIIVIGTSMGGLLATYLAAEHPDIVDGLILGSPFYEYENALGRLIKIPGMVKLVSLIQGPDRISTPNEEWESRVQEGYADHWYTEYRLNSVFSLDDLRAYASRKKFYKKVSCPTLLFYYYKDEEHKDEAASVPAMKSAFEYFQGQPKRMVQVEDGAHVLMSEFVKTDKEILIKESVEFMQYFK